MPKFISNDWEIYFHTQLFGTQYQALSDRVFTLKEKLPEAEFKTHAMPKLFAAITVAIETKIPFDHECELFYFNWCIKTVWTSEKNGFTGTLSTVFPSI
ncbi:type II toxin-antitoxin system YhaV family toxin [Iningainema tapete]|uniref:type II toxin-antitoxin system YhaV family toxin n=1 Tax=Iningainema tapete TaxID=2806730 RepID=UPI003080D7AF